MRKFAMATSLAALAVLSACEEEVPYSTYGMQEEEGVIPGMTVSNARMVLAPVAGNPAAVYFDVAYEGEDGLAISGAIVEGAAESEIHNTFDYNGEISMNKAQPIAMRKGDKVTFESGDKHIMVIEPSGDLIAGGTAKITLKIAGARTHNFEAEIREAGEER